MIIFLDRIVGNNMSRKNNKFLFFISRKKEEEESCYILFLSLRTITGFKVWVKELIA